MDKSNLWLTASVILIGSFAVMSIYRIGQIERDHASGVTEAAAEATAAASGGSTPVAARRHPPIVTAPVADAGDARVFTAAWGPETASDGASVPTFEKPQDVSLTSSLAKRAAERHANWRLERHGGQLAIAGIVPDDAMRQHLLMTAERYFPRSVVERMGIDGPDPAAGWRDVAELAIAQLYAIDGGMAEIADRRLTITGETDDPLRATQIEMAMAHGLPDGFTGSARVQIVPARHTAESTRLCGLTFRRLLARRTIEFASGSSVLAPENDVLLEQLALAVSQCPAARVEVSGHTDSTGSRDDNLQLSQQRAAAVVAYLEDRGADVSRVTAIGFGSALPVASNATDEGRSRNRRIEFKVRN